MKQNLTVQMLYYNQVRDMAKISYISPRGGVKSVYIHRDTFLKLMNGDLERNQYKEGPTLDQQELKDALVKEIQQEYQTWFDACVNTLLEAVCNGKAENKI